VHHGEQDQIAELLAEILIVAGANRSGDFVGLLDEPRKQRLVSLLPVPGTAAGRPEFGNNLAELREIVRRLLQIFHSERCV
jgi:hypothetical protein